MSETNMESYPPVFRQFTQNGNLNLDKDIINPMNGSDPIPVIDLQCLDMDKLVQACKDWGIFRLVNHGIPQTLLSQIQDQARQIFSLSFESKQTLIKSPLSYFWGTPALTPLGDALSTGTQNVNWLEGLNVPLSQLSELKSEDDLYLGSFRKMIEEYGEHMTRIARILYENMGRNLNQAQHHSKTDISESTGFIRVYRYPLCQNDNQTWGMSSHTDSSVLSILNHDQVCGLDVLKDDEEWHQVNPIPNSLIVNLGDMMQAISNDEYKAVKHRVNVNQHNEKISICYFVFPVEGSVIRSSNYKPFTYSDFQSQVQLDVKTLGYKLGLERFKLYDT